MAFDVKAMATKVAAARSASGGNYIRDGKGRLVVKKLRAGGRPEFYNGDTFVAELGVESSQDLTDAVDAKTGQQVKANAPGSTCSYIQQFEGRTKDVAPGNTKAFLEALLGDDLTDDDFAEALTMGCSKEQPFRGMVVDYDTYHKGARDSGKDLTLVNFHHVKQTAEEIKARRAKLDQTAEPVPEQAPAAP